MGVSRHERFAEFWDGAWAISVFVGVLGALGILGFQIYVWLKSGVWTPLNLADGLMYAISAIGFDNSRFMKWLLFPDMWLGIHKVLLTLPASLAMFLIGWGLGHLFMVLTVKARNP